MPIVQRPQLESAILVNQAQWVPASSWLETVTDAQRKNLLGVQVDYTDLASIRTQAAARPQIAGLAPPPPVVDWRNKSGKNHVSPVKNQGGCGSCVSFCTAGVVESMACIEHSKSFMDLSEADLHFCSSHGPSCGGWWPTSAFDEVIARGIVDEASFPYSSAFQGGNPQCIVVPDRPHRATKVSSYAALSTMAERKQWLADVGPVSAVLHVYDDFFSYRSGVYTHVSGAEAGYHCVEVVGYSDPQGCWICKNSWDTGWGEAGYFKIAYGQCGIDETSADIDGAGNLLRFPMWGTRGVKLPAAAAPVIRQLIPAANSDGRLEVFAIETADAATRNIWQTVPHAGPWSNWGSLGGKVKALCKALNSDGRLEVFGIGMDDAVWNNWQTAPHSGPWSGWNSLGGKVSAIAAALNSDGRIEVFAIGTDRAVWHTWQTRPHAGPWSPWASLGGQAKAIAPVLNSDGRLEVFAIGIDDAVWTIWQTAPHAGPWSSWTSLGGKAKAISPIANSDGRLEVFVIGADDALWSAWQTQPHAGPWSSWKSLGGTVKAISSAINSDGRLEVFGIGSDDGLWSIWQTRPHAGPWSTWGSLGGRIKALGSTCNSDGRLEVFGIGMDDMLWHTWQTKPHAGPWSAWNKLG